MLRTPPLPATHVRVGTDHEHFSGAHCRLHARSSNRELTRAVRPRVAATLCPALVIYPSIHCRLGGWHAVTEPPTGPLAKASIRKGSVVNRTLVPNSGLNVPAE